MATSGGQLKNKNAATGKQVREAFRYAIAQLGQRLEGDAAAFEKGLRALALVQVKAAFAGDIKAMQMIAERIDGKAIQGIELTGGDGEELDTAWSVTIVQPKQIEAVK